MDARLGFCILSCIRRSVMIRIILFSIGKIMMHRHRIRTVFSWIARFGYLAYVLYGLISWFRPRRAADMLYSRRTLLYCLFAVGLGSAVSFFIGRIWHRPRPFVRYRERRPLVPHKENASFPSNHSMNSMAIALVLLSRKQWCGFLFLAGSMVLGISRVVCRLHYVTDVIGGFILGAFSAWIVRHSTAAKEWATSILWLYDGASRALSMWRRRG